MFSERKGEMWVVETMRRIREEPEGGGLLIPRGVSELMRRGTCGKPAVTGVLYRRNQSTQEVTPPGNSPLPSNQSGNRVVHLLSNLSEKPFTKRQKFRRGPGLLIQAEDARYFGLCLFKPALPPPYTNLYRRRQTRAK